MNTEPYTPTPLNPAEWDNLSGPSHARAGGSAGRLHRWIPAMAFTLILMPVGLLGADVPQMVKAGLKDLVSGQVESDETHSDENTKTLLGTSKDGKGHVEFSLGVNPTGTYHWTIKQGAAAIDGGTLDSSNGWKASRAHLDPGFYMLEVTRQVEEPGDDTFRRRIDFASGISLDEAKLLKASYEALRLHGLNDYRGLMKALGPVDIRAAVIPPEMRESLGWARIDGLFFFRRFEDIFAAIDAYRSAHPDSARMGIVTEYEMAALFERGLKKSLEAVRFKNEKSDERRVEGRTNLDRFLSLSATHPGGEYTVFPKRNLRQDLWTARVIRGEEMAALQEIPAEDTAGREKFYLHCALLYPEIRPGHAEQNLKAMQDFIKAYPSSPHRPRVELDMAGVALREGERFVQEGGHSEAAPYFDFARELFRNVVEDKEAGIAVSDVEESWEGILLSYYWQKDGSNLITWTDRMIAMTKPGDKRWRQANLYQAAELSRQNKLSEAESLLDQLVAYGFQGNPSNDGRTAAAVKWRIHVARRIGDGDKVRQLLQWVRDSKCVNSIKRDFEHYIP